MREHIRVATAIDLENLTKLVVAFRDHLSQKVPHETEIIRSLKRLLAQENVEFLVAEDSSGIATAYTQTRYYYSLWSTGFEAQIEDVFVMPTARQKGIGSRLVKTVVYRASKHGCRVIALNTNERNTSALNLYTKIGFVAERSRWQGDRQLWLEMSLPSQP